MAEELPPSERIAEFREALQLRPTGDDRFEAPSLDRGIGRLYGGQVIAQALAAAESTADGRPPHSLHAYFLRQGSEAAPVELAVTRNFDGRRFANRHIRASQGERIIFSMSASFHAGGQGLAHAAAMPDALPPEGLPTALEYFDSQPGMLSPAARAAMAAQPFDLRVPESFGRDTPGLDCTMFYQWFRAASPLGDDPRLHRAFVAYTSDYVLLGACIKQNGFTIFRREVMGASLDHALWFHESDINADDWLLYTAESPWTGHGRGLGTGRIFSRDGRLLVSVAQEGMLTLPHAPAKG